MATKTTTQLIDDLDGSNAAETVQYSLDGVDYEIDLSKRNATAFRKVVNQFVPQAREAVITRTAPTVNRHRVDLALIRAWAADNDIPVAPRGRIAAGVIEQYNSAQR